MQTLKSLIFLALLLCIFSCTKKSDDFEYKILPVKSGDKWGYIDKEGKYVVNPQFDNAMLFAEGLACVKVDKKYGYISEDGKYVINPTYKDATHFSEGLACVVIENSYPSYINKKGEIQFTLNTAEKCRVFREGLAAVLIKDKWGFIDSDGKIVIQPQFEDVSDFYEGLSVITKKIKGEELRGYINKKGEIIINPQFKSAYIFKEGFGSIAMNDKWGFIDNTGKIIINPQFEDTYFFSEGMCVIKQGENYGFIDKQGKIVINPQFKSAANFSENLAVVKSSDDKFGYINNEGKFEINPQFEEAGNFTQGIAIIKIGEKYGFIDTKGKIIVNPQFDEVYGWMSSNSQVESDYFDSESFLNIFLKNTDKSVVRGISKETTLKTLIEVEHKGSNMNGAGDFSAKLTDDIIINEYSTISEIVYNFSGKLFSYTPQYDPNYGYYSGNKQNVNYGITVTGIEYTLDLSGKASNKSENIQKAIVTKFAKLLNTQPVKVGESESVENGTLRVKVSSSTGYLSKVFITVEFL
jgi:hypothetical protein